ncbi:MAG: FG-GAP repeat protein, partial [Pirellula sp.]
ELTNSTQGWLIAGRSTPGTLTISAAALQTFSPTAPSLYTQSRAAFSLGDIGRATSNGSTITSDPAVDGYDDFATVSTTSTGQQISIIAGSPLSGGVAQVVRKIVRTGSTLGLTVTLQPVAGDFNGDGKTDLAVLETIGNISSAPVAGTVYLFWNIANSELPFRPCIGCGRDDHVECEYGRA